jgi:hypothetical protein
MSKLRIVMVLQWLLEENSQKRRKTHRMAATAVARHSAS